MTRNAIRAFQRSVAMRETGDPTVDVFVALQDAIKAEAAKAESADKAQAAKADGPPSPPVAGTEPIPRRLAERHRRSGEGRSRPCCATSIFRARRRTACSGRRRARPSATMNARSALRRPASPARRCSNSLKEMRGLTAPVTKTRTSARRTCRRAATRPPAATMPHVAPVPANRRGQSRWRRCRSWRHGARRVRPKRLENLADHGRQRDRRCREIVAAVGKHGRRAPPDRATAAAPAAPERTRRGARRRHRESAAPCRD